MKRKHEVTSHKSGRGKAQCPSNPAYPNGQKIDLGVRPSCLVQLPYPAPECGGFFVVCNECLATVIITAAGRPDDPVSVAMPCKAINITGAVN